MKISHGQTRTATAQLQLTSPNRLLRIPTTPLLLRIDPLLRKVFRAVAWKWLPLLVPLFRILAVMSHNTFVNGDRDELCYFLSYSKVLYQLLKLY
jgi:hypothetical protein